MPLLRTIDGKIHHLKELDFIERQIAGVFSPEKFYEDMKGFLQEERLSGKNYYYIYEMDKLDNWIKEYFYGKIPEANTWLIRAYVIGRLLEESDREAIILKMPELAGMPKSIIEAAKEFRLTKTEVQALTQAIETAGLNITNTTQDTIIKVRQAMAEAIQQHEGWTGVERRLQEMTFEDTGELNRSWKRVAITETNTAFNNAYLCAMKEGEWVRGISMPDACPNCYRDIHNKVYQVIKTPPMPYTDTNAKDYEAISKIWETKVWAGKTNIGRRSGLRKRIDKEAGNTEGNLTERAHHEKAMPAIPYHPHCFSGDTEIYTHQGWQRFDELQKGIEVATLNMETREIEFQQPIAYIDKMYKGRMIRFYNKLQGIEATEGHDMLIARRNRNKAAKEKTVLMKTPANMLHGEYMFYQKAEYSKKEESVKIGRYEFKESLFARLMGYYLSEGSCKSKKYGWEVKISQNKEESKAQMLIGLYDLQEEYGINLRHPEGSIQFNDRDICSYLKKFNNQPERFIPEEVKNLSREGLRIFLDAYILGDGTIKRNKKLKGQKTETFSRTIFTSSKKLADDLAGIILKAGYAVSYSLAETKGKVQEFRNGTYTINHDTWIITLKNSEYVHLSNIQTRDYEGKVYCVEVPNGTILVRQKNFVVWTGNCRCRWIKFNPKFEWIDEEGRLRLAIEDPEKHKAFLENLE
ncbi:MAG TPA: hypothetical protein VHO03_16825 [Ignavibacteriales bacterium]|nr:hypothetical protein [Ignavibacteriales bacterium]